MSKITLVSAAVLMCGEQEFLLARRPEGKVYAGWWEFPGGKVEAGETFHDALVRELHEELGITITRATPWLTREFVYPHATVRIRFFRVTAWEGDIHPHEHDAIAWLKAGEPATVEPVLPANGPILKGLALPTLCALTNAEENGCAQELSRLKAALANGLRFIQIRDKALPASERAVFAREVAAIAKANRAITIFNDDANLARSIGADGIHLSSRSLARCTERPDFTWVGASCHSAQELQHAASLELDYTLLGPVLPTPTHPDAPSLGWQAFEQMVDLSPLPVFALGGMKPEMMSEAWSHGAHGLALMRCWR
ncbi:MAG: 8-oxo-dGTP diphosphatase [Pseudomonadota bacterium]|nr:8-oxo-dGTP diphosphatase [Pseudomonadota bacterium]